MSYIGLGHTYGKKTDFVFNIPSGTKTVSGVDSNGLAMTYTAKLVNVYLNGSLLTPGSDYIANDGTSVVLSTPVSGVSVVVVESFQVFNPADTYTKGEVYTKGEIRDRFAEKDELSREIQSEVSSRLGGDSRARRTAFFYSFARGN